MDSYRPIHRRTAVIGAGVSGLSAAWLLSQCQDVTIFEAEDRIGGHAHTIDVEAPYGRQPVDIGFIVYNEATYPNLTSLFSELGVATDTTDMSLAVSLDNGRMEYAGGYASQLFAQRRNAFRPRFWSMLRDLVRFYREAPQDLERDTLNDMTLGEYLTAKKYGSAFRDDHLLPMAAAIWSVPAGDVLDFPARAFIRFQENHGLLKLAGRPLWRTVKGGSRVYVEKLAQPLAGFIRTRAKVVSIDRREEGVVVRTDNGDAAQFDDVVVATHADQALAMVSQPSNAERQMLGAFRYNQNDAILHSDARLMPQRRRAWASWNYLGRTLGEATPELSVTYWMNRLQAIREDVPLFVTLNATVEPATNLVHHVQSFRHPVLNTKAAVAQQQLWSLQGQDRIWYCGAYFGAGFHEDGLQAGLAVAEAIGNKARPWQVPNESGRIVLPSGPPQHVAVGGIA